MQQDAAAGSLVVNATGLLDDQPGSRLPLPAAWPDAAVVWDLDYRGELRCLRAAEAAAAERRPQIRDGWPLFLHGWSEALAAILGHRPTAELFARMRAAAERAR